MPSRRYLPLIAIVLLLWLLTSLVTYQTWVRGADHRDFYPRWAGARLALLEGRDLYSPDTTRAIQLMLYGQATRPDRDQQGFAYPAQLVVILLPFWLIPNVEIATAAWQGLSLLLLLAAMLLTSFLTDPRPPAWLLVILVVWQYPLLMLFQGQITALVLFSLVLGLWGYIRHEDIPAGAALALAGIKPELALLPWLALLALAVRQRRWKIILAFTISQIGLFALSLLIAGWWLPGWLAALSAYASYAQTTWALALLWNIHPFLALIFLALLTAAFISAWPRPRLSFSLAVCAGLLLLPQTLYWGLTVLLAPLALAYRHPVRWLILAVWLLGWLAMLLPPGYWQAQVLLMPTLSMLLVLIAHNHVTSTHPIENQSPT